MQTLDCLKSIRPVLLDRAVQALAHGTGLREDFRGQLEQFFSLLEQAVETGDAQWMDSVLSLWASSLTQSDLEEGGSSLTRLLKEILLLTNAVCRSNLGEGEALDVIGAILPCFAYSFERAAHYEMEVRINYLTGQLEDTRQTLERLDRSKSDFIAVAAHELKTPLTLIQGYASMLRDALASKEENQQEILLLNGINTGTRRLRSIVDDMIDVSLIDNSLLSLNFQPVWIDRLLNVLGKEFGRSLEERRQTLEVHAFEGSAEMTFGDPERLLQVFRNLISNAIKYTPDGGRIAVDGRKLPGFVEITIADTGIGIEPDDQQIIFEKFGRLGNTSLHSSGKTKFKGGGPGLGLHIAKGIVELHGGAIWVELSGYDEVNYPGSIFHVLIPARVEPPDLKIAKLFAPLIKSAQSH